MHRITTAPELAIIDGVVTPGDRISGEYLLVPDECAGHDPELRSICDAPGCGGIHCSSPEHHCCGDCGDFYCLVHFDPRRQDVCRLCLDRDHRLEDEAVVQADAELSDSA